MYKMIFKHYLIRSNNISCIFVIYIKFFKNPFPPINYPTMTFPKQIVLNPCYENRSIGG